MEIVFDFRDLLIILKSVGVKTDQKMPPPMTREMHVLAR
ncbi:Uncharacterized protein YR821_3198 [Yersinia ruckeri]|uniref:Uncharacterized protein n=1 Tax=Yersinia ruckeri TaxID=29486 RepID=A0A0A8VHG3_YERRU|nr:hypothetical protein yruck0001_1820 [Yersinia ruckeri ATCC 29473]QTD78114.1 Uncharacterized protein YR821_3198 [Yersinia ruckeri]CEK29030.1 hypothetical protein CSF007_16540 [Yersinia ruckeri]